MSSNRSIIIAAAATLATAAGAEDHAFFTPSQPDQHTLHLWHLDEGGPPFVDSGNSPTSLLGLANGARPGLDGLQGLGNAVSLHAYTSGTPGTRGLQGAILMAKPRPDRGQRDNVDAPFPIAGPDGAFTFEAVVKLEAMPGDAPGAASDIITMDGEDGDRVFLLRIENTGFLAFIPLSGDFVKTGGLATIPVSGPHALNTRDWFHLAVTYNGNEGAPSNMKLYWTRLREGLTEANLIGQGTLSADLSSNLSDFAIGNSGRTTSPGHGHSTPFPGLIDEVRISTIARGPQDFFFVPENLRRDKGPLAPRSDREINFNMALRDLRINGDRRDPPAAGKPLLLPPGRHRIDLGFGFPPGLAAGPLAVEYRLEGADENWQPTTLGMAMIAEVLDASGTVVSRSSFPVLGESEGWEVELEQSPLRPRAEPLFLPASGRSLRITLSAGADDTTGRYMVDNVELVIPNNRRVISAWKNGDFSAGESMPMVSGVPANWKREGGEPAIARVIQLKDGKALGLVDADYTNSAEWVSIQSLPAIHPPSSRTAMLRWLEAYGVIGGATYRADFVNVPPGKYLFRAIAAGITPEVVGTDLVLDIEIRSHIWARPWFMPALTAGLLILIGLLVLQSYRRRVRGRLAQLELKHAVGSARARIARDLHDDMGTRISVIMMNSALVRMSLESDPAIARDRLDSLDTAARDLVNEMDNLVWAVNPANDTLDHLASHLAGMAQEIFRDSDRPLRIVMPPDLPALPLPSGFRNQVALAVKESLHNVYKHAGPCTIVLELRLAPGELLVSISDDGRGFLVNQPAEGNGLLNLESRMSDLGGSCSIDSAPGNGTRIGLRCPLPHPFPTT
ncbi:MAG: histidine kinase [Verrucomicrobiota bacterium]